MSERIALYGPPPFRNPTSTDEFLSISNGDFERTVSLNIPQKFFCSGSLDEIVCASPIQQYVYSTSSTLPLQFDSVVIRQAVNGEFYV